jgi:hypothetical protein
MEFRRKLKRVSAAVMVVIVMVVMMKMITVF